MDLRTFEGMHRKFANGEDTPVDYLERCIAAIEEHDPIVRAWASLRIDGARKDALASLGRYRSGQPLSSIDGLPMGIKDLLSTRDLPTGLGIAGYCPVTVDDSAAVQALRAAGAVILGKTVTTELGGAVPSVTTNPCNPARTPGGSSSGSAAAVAAGMVPVAIGTQVGGSILRPAGFCGNIAIKPTVGAIHRGERLGFSHACNGVHANSLDDLWATMVEVANRTGGDPGYPGLFGSLPLPEARLPRRVAVMQGPGWDATDAPARAAFEKLLERLEGEGVVLSRPEENPQLSAFHEMLADAARLVVLFINWENRPILANLMARIPDKLHPITVAAYEAGRRLTLEEYREALEQRETFRQIYAGLAASHDATISLASPGIAPLIDDPSRPPNAMPTGNAAFNIIPSLLGTPALSLPLLKQEGMPLGVQVMGYCHGDEKLVAHCRWILGVMGRAD